MDVLKKKNGQEFVTMLNGTYFIEGVEYTDDTNILLEAIETICEAKYDDLFDKSIIDKRTYWITHFRYQWSGGSLISWHNPTSVWNDELARRGELFCENCGTKMSMYFRPVCFKCRVPDLHTKLIVNCYFTRRWNEALENNSQ